MALGRVSEHDFESLLARGLILKSYSTRAGRVTRAIRRSLAGEGTAQTLSALAATKYSYEELLDSGCRAWTLMEMDALRNHAMGERADLHQGIGFREPVHAY